MKTLKPLKVLFATSALLLTAGSVFAQPATVSGTFAMTTYSGTSATAWTCSTNSIGTDSFFTVDQNAGDPLDPVTTPPSPSLAYLFGAQIYLHSGASCSDGTHTEVLGSGGWATSLYSEDENFPASDGGIAAIAPSNMEGDLSTGFTVTYEWGDAGCTTTDTAGTWSGTHSGTISNPDWDSAKLVVVVDNTFAPQSIVLTTRECLGGGDHADTVYTLTHP